LGCAYHSFDGDAKLVLYASTYLKQLGFTAKLFSFKNPNVEYVDENYDNGIDMAHQLVLNKEVTNPKEILVYITASALHNKPLEIICAETKPLISGSLVIWNKNCPPYLAAVEELSTLEFDSIVDNKILKEDTSDNTPDAKTSILEDLSVSKLLEFMNFFGDGYDYFISIKNKDEILNHSHRFTADVWEKKYNEMLSNNNVAYYFNCYNPLELEDVIFFTKADIIDVLKSDLAGVGTASNCDDYKKILDFIKGNKLDIRYTNLFIVENEDSNLSSCFIKMRDEFILEQLGLKEKANTKIHNTINEVACLIQDKLGVTHGDETPEQANIIDEAVDTIVNELVNIALQNKED
jgi:hypothetical protein